MRIISTVAAAALTLTLLPGAATAKPSLQAKLDCDDGRRYIVEGQPFGNAFSIVGSNRNFVVQEAFLVDPLTGALVQFTNNLKSHAGLVTCEYTAPISGREFVFKGFFTPRQ
jgi:hypothetical protein